jgi:peroxiredoxin
MASPVWLVFIINQAIFWLMSSNYSMLSIGVMLSAIPLLLFLSYIMLFKRLARTSEHLLAVSIPSFVGFLITFIAYLKAISFSSIFAMLFAMSAFFITFLYIYWYSNNNREISKKIALGKKMPPIFVQDTAGNEIHSESFYANSQALIFFYRGNWCPLCMAQIDEIVTSYKKFKEKNINVIFIAPQSTKNTQSLANKHQLDFKFYTDKDNKSAKKIGINHTFGLPFGFQALGYDSDSVYPTVIAIDDTGTIIYNDQTSNYRMRPEPEKLLAIFSL